MADALFERTQDLVSPTRLTEGPWSPDAQHGGATAALLAGEFERIVDVADMVLVRLTLEYLRPIPLEPMRLSTSIVHEGGRVRVLEATLHSGDIEIVRGMGTAIRRADIALPFDIPVDEAPAHPEDLPKARMFDNPGAFAVEAFDIRRLEGEFHQPGPGKAWFRLQVPVVEGSVATSVETACAVADFGNGVSNWDPTLSWFFINPDLTVHLARPPVGEWVMLDAETALHHTGTGVAASRLSDVEGRFGRGTQSLFVGPRNDR